MMLGLIKQLDRRSNHSFFFFIRVLLFYKLSLQLSYMSLFHNHDKVIFIILNFCFIIYDKFKKYQYLHQVMISILRQRFPPHFKAKNQIDQVVALILKNVPTEPLSLLMLQRNYNPKDVYSGDLCLPGGYREEGETCVHAAIRETEEETSINLNNSAEYLGMIDYTPFTKIGKSKFENNTKPRMLYLGILLFELKETVNVKLNPSEIRDYKWIPFQNFFIPKHQFKYNEKKYNVKLKQFEQIKQVKHFSFPSIDIGMESDLWGLTLYSLAYMIFQLSKVKNIEEYTSFTIDHQFVQQLMTHCGQVKAISSDDSVSYMHLHPLRRAFIQGRYSKL